MSDGWRLFNDGWHFALTPPGTPNPAGALWAPAEIPHDWLIADAENLYAPGVGWYKKSLSLPPEEGKHGRRVYLRFDGVYMDCTVYLNGSEACCWKYGYSSFGFECGALLRAGENELMLRVNYQPPNSRWYSGAGIYRDVWLGLFPDRHIVPEGLYITPQPRADGAWRVEVDTELSGDWAGCEVRHRIYAPDGALAAENRGGAAQVLAVEAPQLWDIASPALYRLESTLFWQGEAVQTVSERFGFRRAAFKPDRGFWLNGRHVKLQGACQHHDLGSLGAAVNRSALRRQLLILREMGANAIRTAHNMPAPALMELCDEMGFLVCSEAFDMWEQSKTEYDYARFFPEWAARDVAAWIRRDRNHPSVIMWSIGNEIADTQFLPRGAEITQMLAGQVALHDPKRHAPVTIGSNYMATPGARHCADIVKLAGYNYSERLYVAHHTQHPDWVIYGSETASVAQSRGIYHFPLATPLLADEDEQCSALGNSSTSWGARNTEACILDDYHAEFSAGQFIWSGFDYIGEPTPYHTKNSYLGQVDTAGFPKDSFYIFKAGWTSWREAPFVHIFPFWDFSPGQPIDVRVCSNAPEVELFFDGESLGRRKLGLHLGRLVADYRLDYREGTLSAVAYGADGQTVAQAGHGSFGDAAALALHCEQREIPADGQSLAFVSITACDAQGRPVENATNRVKVEIDGPARLLGLDSGDATDYESYKSDTKRLFSGKLLAVVAPTYKPGDIAVCVTSPGLAPAQCAITALPAAPPAGASDTLFAGGVRGKQPFPEDEIPVRKLELHCEGGFRLGPQRPYADISAVIRPANASYTEVEWAVTDASGIPARTATLQAEGAKVRLTALGDGEVWLRCYSRNGTGKVRIISQLRFQADGLGGVLLNPYAFVAGGLYTHSNTTLTNGNEHGIATPREGESHVGFAGLDFGAYGADTLTLSIFSLTPPPFPIEIWAGMPDEAGAEKLCTVTYTGGSRWNTYIPQTYTLPRRITGVATLCFVFRQKVHLGGFVFQKPDKAFSRLAAADADAIYGDAFTPAGSRVENIGNNVTIRFTGLDFSVRTPQTFSLCGQTPLKVNPVQLRMARREEDGQAAEENVRLLPFAQTEGYEAQCFPLEALRPGMYDAQLVFLPGSRFGLEWIQFEGEAEE